MIIHLPFFFPSRYIFNFYISITADIQLFYKSVKDTAEQLDISTMSFLLLSVCLKKKHSNPEISLAGVGFGDAAAPELVNGRS